MLVTQASNKFKPLSNFPSSNYIISTSHYESFSNMSNDLNVDEYNETKRI
jgi:hypothetical protein